METFPQDLSFCYPWRPYQQRILDAAEMHERDGHYHVVAAPGSGKTVLGLELMLRLDRPAVVFAPSLGIRDQWIRRFCDLFLRQFKAPDWISTDLGQPGLLTVVTYQSLGSAIKKEGEQLVIDRLKAAGVTTLVFDEAHHLRRFWWQCLTAVKEGLDLPIMISLTATPPYDVSQVEWNRYMALCGEVDEEISTAELVKERNLCPHQDYIYFCRPSKEEQDEVLVFQKRVQNFMQDLALDEEVVEALGSWPAVMNPEAAVDELTKYGEFSLSVAIYLRFATGLVPQQFLEFLGLDEVTLPELTAGWTEVLLNGLMYRVDYFIEHQSELIKRLRNDLSAFGAIHQRKVLLLTTPHQAKVLRSSLSKLKAISDIVESEYADMQISTRCVILTDYICEREFPSANQPDRSVSRVGVVPIFEYLRKLRYKGLHLGVLTGKLVIIPTAIRPIALQLAEELHLDVGDLETTPLWHDESYLVVSLRGPGASRIVEWITALFQQGHIQVLVGTTALLGEGWDAPAINSLILATVVGSYMSTNQIRGRAIRVWPDDPAKTANIWHLACMHENRVGIADSDLPPNLMDDVGLMFRRFDTFTGLSFVRYSIEDGLDRMGLSRADLDWLNIERWNADTIRNARDRNAMRDRWWKVFDVMQSLPGSRIFRPSSEIFVPCARVPAKPIVHLLFNSGFSWATWIRQRAQLKTVRQTAELLYDKLCEFNFIEKGGNVVVSQGRRDILARLGGVSRRDEAVFTAALAEIYNPLQKPRYLIRMRKEFYAVPQLLATNRELADAFFKGWRSRVGRGVLVSTLGKEGKTMLLQARQKYLATRHHDVVRSHQVVS